MKCLLAGSSANVLYPPALPGGTIHECNTQNIYIAKVKHTALIIYSS